MPLPLQFKNNLKQNKMKNYILIVIASLFAFGCSKNGDVQPHKSPIYKNITPHSRIGHGDDDSPIIIEMTTVDVSNKPLGGSAITFTNGEDTIINTTDVNGKYLFHLPRIGVWGLSIVHQAYVPISTELDIEDTSSVKTYTLQAQ